MFNIYEYNACLLYVFLALFTAILYLSFRNKMAFILDPIFLHLIWLAANLAFLCSYFLRYEISLISMTFFAIFLAYAFILKILLRNVSSRLNFGEQSAVIFAGKERRVFILYVFAAIACFYSFIPFVRYALTITSFRELFLYKFIDMQGRNPFFRVMSTAAPAYFVYLSFVMYFFIRKYRRLTIMLLFAYVAMQLFSGMRAAIILLLFSFGLFVYFHYGFFNKKDIRRYARYGTLLIVLGFLAASLITSLYGQSYILKDGAEGLMNRVIASADGMEYYLKYGGSENIKTGIVEFFKSIYGIYLKRISTFEVKNIGHQLMELAIGSDLPFAQGPNYTLPLQVMVLGWYFCPIYVFLITFIVVRLRELKTQKLYLLPLYYYACSNSFIITQDIEYWFFALSCGVLFYFALIFPLLRFKIKYA